MFDPRSALASRWIALKAAVRARRIPLNRFELRLGKPCECISSPKLFMYRERRLSRRSDAKADFFTMWYVYILRSEADPDRHYVGFTEDLKQRIKAHNSGKVSHTSKFTPWAIKTYLAFSEKEKAIEFERYL